MPAENHVIESPRAGQFPKSAFDNLPPSARKIYKAEQALREQDAQRYDTKTRRADEIRREKAEAQIEAQKNEREPSPSAEVAKDSEQCIADCNETLKTLEAEYEAESRLLPGCFFHQVNEFINANAATKFKDANYSAPLNDDLVADHDACREARTAKQEERKAVKRAPVPDASIVKAVDHLYSEACSRMLHELNKIRRPEERVSGRLVVPALQLPTLTIPNGAGGLSRLTDAATLLFATFGPEIRERLKAMALNDHDSANVIPLGDRPAMLKKIDADILEIERKAEFIYRTGKAHGINTGPRLAAHPLAILDIDFA